MTFTDEFDLPQNVRTYKRKCEQSALYAAHVPGLGPSRHSASMIYEVLLNSACTSYDMFAALIAQYAGKWEIGTEKGNSKSMDSFQRKLVEIIVPPKKLVSATVFFYASVVKLLSITCLSISVLLLDQNRLYSSCL